MSESILTGVKQLLGIDSTYTHFDPDIIAHINSVLFVLYQMGVTDTPYKITGTTETWSNFLGDPSKLELVKSYVYLKCKKIFDPPTSGTIMTAIDEEIAELEWRISVEVDPKKED